MDFCCKFCLDIESDVAMRSFCFLTSIELIGIANCSLLDLHSNDLSSLKISVLKNKL